MATETTGSHPKALWPGVKAMFGTSYNEKPLVCEMVFDKQTSDKAYEERVENTGYGLAPVKAESASLQYDTAAQGYVARMTNVTYGLGAKVSMEAIEDNLYESVASKRATMLAKSMRQTKETVTSNVLNRGFNAAYVGGDGVELFSSAHPTLDGTQSNILAVAADLSEASLEDCLTAIRGFKDKRGLLMEARGQKLVVPAEEEFNASRILNSTLRSGTDFNDINAMKAGGMLPGGICVWDYLTDPDAFFITTDVDEGLILQERKELVFDQDNDFDTKNACMSAIERYATGWADWRGAFGTPGSG